MIINNFFLIKNAFTVYLVFLGIFLLFQAIAEFAVPDIMYKVQKKWIFHKLFPLHGIILMIGGLPMTFFRESFAGKIMMAAGIVVVFTGPFFLLYPSKIRAIFTEAELESDEQKNKLIVTDAVVRFCLGLLILFVMLYNEKAFTVIKNFFG